MFASALKYCSRNVLQNQIWSVQCRYTCKPSCVVEPGAEIPYIDLFENDPQTVVNIRDFCCKRKVILFGVPGAFTPACTSLHLPGYIARADELKKLGVDEIGCIAVNDPYVMTAWGKSVNAQGKVRMLADTQGCFTNALGLGIELPSLGGLRTKRYSMVISGSIIQYLNLEPDGLTLRFSGADKIRV